MARVPSRAHVNPGPPGPAQTRENGPRSREERPEARLRRVRIIGSDPSDIQV